MINTPVDAPEFSKRFANLASPRLGAKVTFASDDFFADKSRLIEEREPQFVPDKYDDHGKWMDGWESRRRREGGHDYCLISLAAPSQIYGACIDTAFFTGNFPPAASIEGALCEGEPNETTVWRELTPNTSLQGDSKHYLAIEDAAPVNWVRLNIYPDGGVARLRLYGQISLDWPELINKGAQVELTGILNQGRVVGYNNAHYGNVSSLIYPDKAENMGDGWETRRRREPGYDWIVLALGAKGVPQSFELDTAFFKGNFPHEFSLQGASISPDTPDDVIINDAESWPVIFNKTRLQADMIHRFDLDDAGQNNPVTHIRLNIYPDGGVSRFRLFGVPV